MAEPAGLLSMGSHRVGHDWSDLAAAAAVKLYVNQLFASKLLLFPHWQVQSLSHIWHSVNPWTAARRTRRFFTIFTIWVCSDSCPLSQWCHPIVSSSVTSISSCPQSSPASGSFPMSQLFTSDGQGIGASASASILPMNIKGWFPLGLTGFISLLSNQTLPTENSKTFFRIKHGHLFCWASHIPAKAINSSILHPLPNPFFIEAQFMIWLTY